MSDFQPGSSTRRTQRHHMASHPTMEALMRVLRTIHASSASMDLERQRRGQELLGKLMAPPLGIRYWDFSVGHVACEWARPARHRNPERILLYCHGGGYTSGNLGYARTIASKLAQETRREVLSFDYRLAPEHHYPAPLEDALLVWEHLLSTGHLPAHITLVGDSAGGNLALALCHRLKETGRLLPGGLVLFSPWTDMTLSGASYTERAKLDPMLSMDYISAMRAAYAPHGDYTSPLLSPLLGDFTRFPPTLVQVGSHEILLSDAVALRDRMVRAGVFCQLEVWKDMWHVFQMFPLRRAARAIRHVGDFIARLD